MKKIIKETAHEAETWLIVHVRHETDLTFYKYSHAEGPARVTYILGVGADGVLIFYCLWPGLDKLLLL